MSDDGFTPDPVPVSRAPASTSDDGFEPDPMPSAGVPVKITGSIPDAGNDDGFEADPAPVASTAGGDPKGFRGFSMENMMGAPIDAVKETLGTAARGIGAALEPLQQPMRELAAPVAKKLGIPVSREKLAMYPWTAPDASWSTVVENLSDRMVSDESIIKTMLDNGFSAETAARVVGAKKVGVFGLGAFADFMGDPLTYIGVGVANKATREALEAGSDI